MGYKTLHRKIRIDQHEIIPLVSESHSCPSLMRFDSQDMWIAVNSKFFSFIHKISDSCVQLKNSTNQFKFVCLYLYKKKLVHWYFVGSVYYYLFWRIPSLKEAKEKKTNDKLHYFKHFCRLSYFCTCKL